MAAKKAEKLNWQSSIVDLMKRVDLDPSPENRKALAGELGYTGDTQDSASMNVRLHRQVMLTVALDSRVPTVSGWNTHEAQRVRGEPAAESEQVSIAHAVGS
jgi:hypothetical protein